MNIDGQAEQEAQHVREVAVMHMALDTTDMKIERSSICPVRGEQQSTSDECSVGF